MGTNYYAVTEDGSRLHLTKISVGWQPAIQLHGGEQGCECMCFEDEQRYRNWTEFTEFVRRDDLVLEDEYGQEIAPDELIEKMLNARENAERKHELQRGRQEFARIDGWAFMGGAWS